MYVRPSSKQTADRFRNTQGQKEPMAELDEWAGAKKPTWANSLSIYTKDQPPSDNTKTYADNLAIVVKG